MSDAPTSPGPGAAGLGDLSDAKRALLARRLAGRAAGRAGIPRRPDPARAPLSGAQEEVWLLEQLAPGLTAYHLANAWRVRGALDERALGTALDALVARHEALRTTFAVGEAGPEQRIGAPQRVEVAAADLRGVAEPAREAALRDTLAGWTRRTFDLARELPVRAGVVTLADDERVVLFVTHHLVTDGVSRGVLFEELATAYAAARAGAPVDLPPVAVQYGDYAAWERDALGQERLAGQLARWRDRLADAPDELDLPTDRPRGATPSFESGKRTVTLPPALVERVRAVALAHDATPFMVLLSAFSALLARYSAQDDVVVGVPVAGRSRAELARAVGFYTNTVAVRTDLAGDPTFAELIGRTRARTLDAFDDQEVPFARVVTALRDAGRPAHAPVFRVMFALQNHATGPGLALDGLDVEPLGVDLGSTKFDLTMLASERAEGLRMTLEYRADLYDGATAERMLDHLARLLGAAIVDPATRLSALPLMGDDERRLVVATWNDTARDYPDTTLVALLDAQRGRTPDAPAVTFEGRTLSYAELHDRADRLAAGLRAAGVGQGMLVAVSAERSHELVIALVAVLKAGGAYVPIDPEYPADRVAYMLEDSAPAVLLTQRAVVATLPPFDGRMLLLDAPESWPEGAADAARVAPGDPAYMIYTSGSTGRPKGALNAHRGIVNRLLWMQEQYALGPADAVLQKTPYSFDVSVWEFFWPLLVGARLVVARPGGHRDPSYLAELMAAEGVTTLHFVPSMLRAFLGGVSGGRLRALGAVRHVVCSGEALPAELVAGVRDALPQAALHNLYGPTECAVDVSHWTCGEADARPGANVPIGRPVANTQLYVLDRVGNPQPVGVPGELHLAGVQVGMGYHGRPELTAEKFVVDPFASAPGARMYRSGDRARWRADGAIEYLGRLDDQIKLRGFRIELGEIASALERHEGVATAVAVMREERGGQVVAYVVPDAETAGAVRRAAALERAGEIDPAQLAVLPNGLAVVHRNRGETEFLYEEIFANEAYLHHGVTLGDGDVVFDVGANVGLFTVLAGTRVRGARVYAFEPIPPLHEAARANAALHDVAGRVLPCGLGSRAESATFTFYPRNSVLSGRYASAAAERDVVLHFLANDETARRADAAALEELVATNLESVQYECEIRTLSDVVREEGIDRIDLLKIDVEKAEWDVLSGVDAADWPKVRQVVVEVHDDGHRLDRIVALLRTQGFDCVAEEERMLSGTGLYTVYAKRPGLMPRVATPSSTRWGNADALRADLMARLARELPDYMVPSALVFLDALPLTGSGKLDRRALPAPHFAAPVDDAPPQGPVEEVVASVWRQALQAPHVGRTTRFLDLGGHSLLMTTVLAALAKLFRIQLPIRAMFEAPTVAGLAAALAAREAAPGQVEKIARLVLKLQSAAATPADGSNAPQAGMHA